MNKERIETFSDGVFAIAITLLVLTIAQPTHFDRLAHDLLQRWPSLAAYVVSFVVIFEIRLPITEWHIFFGKQF